MPKTKKHTCDLCGKTIKKKDLLTIKDVLKLDIIGRIHLNCFETIPQWNIYLYNKDKRTVETLWDNYETFVKYVREMKTYEKIKRRGNERENRKTHATTPSSK